MIENNVSRVIVISPFYNTGKEIIKCIKSLKIQNFTNFEVYFIDDMSTDNTLEHYYSEIGNDTRFNITINTEKKYALRNTVDCLNNLNLDDDAVIIQVDGDDFLYDENSIGKVVECYNYTGCWVTYGSYINKSSGLRGACSSKLPKEIIENQEIRKYPWVTSHLKTFKYGIFKKILIQDLKDKHGEWLKTAWDLALMYPLIEMACEKVVYIPEILYVYNDESEISDVKINKTDQDLTDEYLRGKPKYKKVNNLSNNIPRIKICHLLLDPNQPQDIALEKWDSVMAKQKASVSAFEKIASNFACYSQMYSVVNRTELPSENCAEPGIINYSKEFTNNSPILSYGHYGCYSAHRSAIEDFGNYDALIVVESDVVYDLSPEEFTKKIYDAYEFGLARSGSLFTFGQVLYGSGSRASVSDTAIFMGDYKQIDHFLCAHCYMVFRSERESIQHKILNSGWHAWDIWLYWNYDMRVPIFATAGPIVYEPEGYSVIDYQKKEL